MPLDFQFDCPLALFEKGDAPIGKQRRIAGIISTETRDRQGEVLLQNGLNFDSFLKNGWYNDNHTKDTTGILGYPESVRRFSRGEILPDGHVADTNCTWAEGYLLPTKKADEIWELGQALAQTGRRLGYSVEGKIQKRTGPNKKTVAQALVRNVAITNCPVNDNTRLEVLAKSLQSVEDEEDEKVKAQKALMMGPATGPAAPVGPQTGVGAGQVITGQSLEHDQKYLTKSEAIAWLVTRQPSLTGAQAERIWNLTRRRIASGQR